MGFTRLGVLLFVALAALGPLYTAPGYSPVANVISELAAQSTPGNYIMSAGFLALGAGVATDGFRPWRVSHTPYIAFGVFFAAAGLFGHRPITPSVPYDTTLDAVHSALATLSGISLTIGFIWQGIRGHTTQDRALALLLAALCMILPLLMFSTPEWQGLVQRCMYLAVFAWLWVFYPSRTHA
jgi:hypothetical membrane protein